MLSPIKKREDIISLMRNEKGTSLKTPRARFPLADRRNVPIVPKQAEFTPLLQSVTKKNFERSRKRKSGPETPAFLRNGNDENRSPALPAADASAMYGSDFGSSVLGNSGSTPIPQVASSSAQSTPLAALPKRDATGVVNDQGNLMTLREQENVRLFYVLGLRTFSDTCLDHRQGRERKFRAEAQNPFSRRGVEKVRARVERNRVKREY